MRRLLSISVPRLGPEGGALTPRWYPLRYHEGQHEYATSRARFNVVACGRRSGKTEKAKRKVVAAAINAHRRGTRFYVKDRDPRFFVAAPTRDQVKRIYWRDLKNLIPRRFLMHAPNESSLVITLLNGAEIHCLGMDKPERMEGTPWNGGILDEYASMKADVWGAHVRPMLSDRRGWCDPIGVPEGRNHYYDMWKRAEEYEAAHGAGGRWRRHHWISADILPAEEIEEAKRDLDELTYQQEYEASFVCFTGRAYWPYAERTHNAPLGYNPRAPLGFGFDFNVEPGCAVVVQEQRLPSGEFGTGVVGEVWIPRGSNSLFVARRLVNDWGAHQGVIKAYGDPTGGAGGSAKLLGSDWQIIKDVLWGHFGTGQVSFSVARSCPRERARVNAVNSRLLSADGRIRLMVDPARAPHVVRDLEAVTVVEGGSGELDKKANLDLTHISDALGYYCDREFPVKRHVRPTGRQYWK